MLTDRVQKTWRRTRRRPAGGPEPGRAIHHVERHPPSDPSRQVHRAGAGMVTLTLTMLLAAGPNLLTEEEVARRRRSPAPRRSRVPHPADLGYSTGVDVGRVSRVPGDAMSPAR